MKKLEFPFEGECPPGLESKQEKELFYVNSLWTFDKSLPRGTIDLPKPPAPDLILHSANKKIGIEVTEMWQEWSKGVDPTEQEGFRSYIVRKAQKFYKKTGNPNVSVSVFFSHSHPLKKDDVRSIIEKLVEIVCRNIPDKDLGKWEIQNYGNSLPDQVSSLRVVRRDASRLHWKKIWSTYVPDLPARQVAQRLERKEPNLPGYLKFCDECWLVMVVGGFSASSTLAATFDVTDDVTARTYNSNFGRVICFDRAMRKGHRLTVKPISQAAAVVS